LYIWASSCLLFSTANMGTPVISFSVSMLVDSICAPLTSRQCWALSSSTIPLFVCAQGKVHC
jgi:hypothetical protein